jgi:hypothetical protein
MHLTELNIDLIINDSSISCSYSKNLFESGEWQIDLSDIAIVYTEGKKVRSFPINDVKEIQFEVDTAGQRNLEAYRADAYLILKSDPEPQQLFSLMVIEPSYGLLSQTKSYAFSEEVVKFIGNRYAIPWSYKMSIETKKKTNRYAFIIFFFILMVIVWILEFRKG